MPELNTPTTAVLDTGETCPVLSWTHHSAPRQAVTLILQGVGPDGPDRTHDIVIHWSDGQQVTATGTWTEFRADSTG